MSYYADRRYDAYVEKVRKANKEHICSACGLVINRKDLYCHVSWVFDGKAHSVKRCGACQKTHDHLKTVCSDQDRWPNERLACGEDYEAEWGDAPPDEIAILPFLTAEERSSLLKK